MLTTDPILLGKNFFPVHLLTLQKKLSQKVSDLVVMNIKVYLECWNEDHNYCQSYIKTKRVQLTMNCPSKYNMCNLLQIESKCVLPTNYMSSLVKIAQKCVQTCYTNLFKLLFTKNNEMCRLNEGVTNRWKCVEWMNMSPTLLKSMSARFRR